MGSESIIDRMNKLGKKRIPFLFILDFEMRKPIILPLDNVNPNEICYSFNGLSNVEQVIVPLEGQFEFISKPVEKERYAKSYSIVQQHLRYGDSFLLNLTMPSNISTNLTLKDIFNSTKAKYKLWVKDNFVVFSPEIFIQTKGRKISSFPMKGTIDSSVPDAENKLMVSKKELAEHFTIVDLIRNDLSIVSKNVVVDRFRYIDEVVTHRGSLLQMSSEVSGELPENFKDYIGDMILSMLPAGSISGAPKKKTIEIIKKVEGYNRGYYTGICGIFDGENIDSGVMIRYIEQTPEGLQYKSGGGITAQSKLDEEYQELIDKIYIPVS